MQTLVLVGLFIAEKSCHKLNMNGCKVWSIYWEKFSQGQDIANMRYYLGPLKLKYGTIGGVHIYKGAYGDFSYNFTCKRFFGPSRQALQHP